MPGRIKKVNSLIKKELSGIILREVDFPNDILVTVTRVESSSDLSQAKIFISTIPKNRANETLRILNGEIYAIQQELNKRLNMRPVPKILFKEEEKTEEAARVEELLEEIKK